MARNLITLVGRPRIRRQVSFDIDTFDFLQQTKRRLAKTLGRVPTNSEVLRALLLEKRLADAGEA